MDINEFVTKIRDTFENEISKKNSWGKNEVLKQLDLAIAKVSLEELSNKVK
jgi:hypothetical protein